MQALLFSIVYASTKSSALRLVMLFAHKMFFVYAQCLSRFFDLASRVYIAYE